MPVFLIPLIILFSVVADQIIKFAVTRYLEPVLIFELIPGVFRLRYVENSGAIFGSFADYTIVLTVFSAILVAITVFLLVTKKVKSKYVAVCMLLMVSGGIGNLIDRVRLGFVIDYFEFTFVNFAVFNFADCLITVGAALLIAYLINDMIVEAKRSKAQKLASEEKSDEGN